MEIRAVRDRADVRGMDRVNRRAWRVAYADVLTDDLLDREPATDAQLDARLEAIESWTGAEFVAVDGDETGSDATGDGAVVGYAIARWGTDTKPFVDASDAGLKEVYVDPERWGEGVGSALVERVERAVPDEYDGLVLSMLAGNDRARRFYESRGFVETGAWDDEMGGETYDTVLFRKAL